MSNGLNKLRNQRQRRQAPPPDHPRPQRPLISASLERLAPNPHNPRTALTEIEELAQSFRAVGQLQPVTAMTRDAYLKLMPDDEEIIGAADLVVVAGCRRLAAAHVAPLKELKIHVDDSPESASHVLESALVENMHRIDLHPLEEARSLVELRNLRGLNQKELAARLGRTPAFISQRLSLLNLSSEMQDLFLTGQMKIEQARTLARHKETDQISAWQDMINGVNHERSSGRVDSTDHLTVDGHEPEEDLPSSINGVKPTEANGAAELDGAEDQRPINGVNPGKVLVPDGIEVNHTPDPGHRAVSEDHEPAGELQHEQLTLDLQWEPQTMADRLYEELGPEKFAQLLDAGMERLK